MREPAVQLGQIGLPMSAPVALQKIDEMLDESGG
jgi:hypothetical protein